MLLTKSTCIGTIDTQEGQVRETLCVSCAAIFSLLSDEGASYREAQGTVRIYGSDIMSGKVSADAICDECGDALLAVALYFDPIDLTRNI
jgi:hypothetical protein